MDTSRLSKGFIAFESAVSFLNESIKFLPDLWAKPKETFFSPVFLFSFIRSSALVSLIMKYLLNISIKFSIFIFFPFIPLCVGQITNPFCTEGAKNIRQ